MKVSKIQIFEKFFATSRKDSNLSVKNESIIVWVFLTKIYLLSKKIFGVTKIAFLSVTKPYVAVNK
jgi:hypothetical protein